DIINLEENHGKGNALAIGIEEARDGMLVFVDADMINLTKHHIYCLIEPLLSDRADMVLGYPPFRSHARELVFGYFKWLTGERALWRKDILPLVDAFRYAGYGVEAIINHAMRQRRVHLFELNGLFHVLKFDRWSLPISAQKYLREGMEIAGTMLPVYYRGIKDGIINRFHPSSMN
ncbi:MAG: glycosyltransferase, partial [Candidatus Marinimicrobia bacterium]|nr:glycosyltransferase [Candidatus Neomarinimicrobiota bacterium]